MRSRLLALLGALALTGSGLLVVMSGLAVDTPPATAATYNCSIWNTHPDKYSGGAFKFSATGTKLRTGPYNDCTAVGEGYESQALDVHCWVKNTNGVTWWYVVDRATGKRGWTRTLVLWAGPLTNFKALNCYA